MSYSSPQTWQIFPCSLPKAGVEVDFALPSQGRAPLAISVPAANTSLVLDAPVVNRLVEFTLTQLKRDRSKLGG